ncbi:hypothetical protein HPC49_31225 [Pyxidicoccus fallax]|uniref:Uncharacterized protein n=1 Tax=Pyxidicoccus fallax TaxID=394095 RepID=A0A848L4N9_9BACT|nr:hypothetical protein [Pyxidicoccus fallax]NMO13629.1 hypothetical protein [Pyxidicoccus fallax]NPC82683.1 hypothetical protein [Pyxidicoccus fallax]
MKARLAVVSGVVVLSYLLLALEGVTVDRLVIEDGPVEMAGALGLGVTAAVFLFAAVRAWRSPEWRMRAPAFVALGLLFFLGAGEEISWGQRLFGWGTPEALAQVNVQQETNLHNLAFMKGWLDAGRLFNLFTFGFVLVLPLAARAAPSLAARLERLVPIPPLVLAVPFIVNQVASKAVPALFEKGYTGRFDFVQCVTELKETNLSILFVLVAFALLKAVPSSRPAASAAVLPTSMPHA